MKRKLIVYDWDGTLGDTLIPTAMFFNDMFEKFGHVNNPIYPIPLEKEKIRRIFKAHTMTEFLIQNEFSEEECQEVYSIYTQLFSSQKYPVRTFKGIKKLLKKINEKHRQQILSLNSAENIIPILEREGISISLFESVIGKEELEKNYGSEKSNYFIYLSKVESIPLREIYFVGDSNYDLESALESGVNFIGVNYGWGRFKENNGFPVASSPKRLSEILTIL